MQEQKSEVRITRMKALCVGIAGRMPLNIDDAVREHEAETVPHMRPLPLAPE